ncbi:hypothetical protein JZ751_003073 [Albula glossodonta]|uniref:Thioredoxin domain-containing protein n=1 Tax=Albula glossodonta TaxID=121402 RepID=A0A8T2N8N9_9TELE|nr:hypothetical protein JZ751_003073 [Albula glossodonta]
MASLTISRIRAPTALWRSTLQFMFGLVILSIQLTSRTALAKKDHLKVITDGNWEEILEGEWMIEFFAPWCPACQQLQPVWNEFAEWGEDMGVNIAKVDVTEQPGLSGRFIITALPTIYHVTLAGLIGSAHCHNYLTEQIGIPVWGSYAIFALATLFSGLALGLILVFIADCVFPSRRFASPSYYQKKQALKQAQMMKQLEVEHEADAEEEDEEEEEEEEREREELWRRGVPEGRPEPRTVDLQEETLRRRVVGTPEEEEDT